MYIKKTFYTSKRKKNTIKTKKSLRHLGDTIAICIVSVDTTLILYIRLQRQQSNQSNQSNRKQTDNKYPLEQNENKNDNENGCQNCIFDGNKRCCQSSLI